MLYATTAYRRNGKPVRIVRAIESLRRRPVRPVRVKPVVKWNPAPMSVSV